MSQTRENMPTEPVEPTPSGSRSKRSAARPTPFGNQPPPAAPAAPAPLSSPTPAAPATSPGPFIAPAPPSTRPDRRPRRPPRRTRVVIRSVGPWSVLRFSLFFYFCVWLIVFLALVIIYMLMSAVGAIDSLETLLGYLFSTGQQSTRGPTPIEINEGVVGLMTFFAGCVLTLVWSLVNVLVAFLYNLISDVVGGVEVTLAEKRHGGGPTGLS